MINRKPVPSRHGAASADAKEGTLDAATRRRFLDALREDFAQNGEDAIASARKSNPMQYVGPPDVTRRFVQRPIA